MKTFNVTTPTGKVIPVEAETKEQAIAKAKAQASSQPSYAAQEEISKLESFGRGALQGASFGYSDELTGVLESAFSDKTYEQARDESRAANEAARLANPKTYLGGELGGGIAVPGLGALGGARALNTLGRAGVAGARTLGPTGRLAASGAAAGGVAGSGYSESDDLGGLARDTAIGAGVGGVISPAIGLGVRGVNALGQGIRGVVEDTLMANPQRIAERRLAGVLDAEGFANPAAVSQALDDLGPSARIADLGPTTQAQAELIAKSPGAGRRLVRGAVEERQAGQQARIAAAADEQLKPMWKDYGKFMDDLDTQRKAQAGPLYDAARDRGFEMTEGLANLFRKPSIERAARRAQKSLADEIDSPLGTAQTQGTMSLNIVDQTLKELQDDIGKALRSGSNEKASRLIRLKKALEREIYAQNPEYKQARQVWAGSKQLERAADQGRSALKGGQLADWELERLMREYTQGEQQAFRVGLMRGIVDRLETAGTTHNAVNRIAGNTRLRGLIREAFGSEEAAENFLRTVDNETILNATYNQVRGGSRTAMLQKEGGIGNYIDPGSGIAMAHDPAMGAMAMILRGVSRSMRKDLTPEDSLELARLLFGDVDEGTLRRVMRRRAHDAFNAPVDQGPSAMIGGGAAGGGVWVDE